MFNFKGIHAFYGIATVLLLFQMFKLTNFVRSVEVASFVGVFLTIWLSVKLIVFDKRLRETKHWLLLVVIVVQEVLIGLDQRLPITYYNMAVMCTLLLGICLLLSMDAPSVRRKMDDDTYVLKRTSTMLTVTYAIALMKILVGYMFIQYPL